MSRQGVTSSNEGPYLPINDNLHRSVDFEWTSISKVLQTWLFVVQNLQKFWCMLVLVSTSKDAWPSSSEENNSNLRCIQYHNSYSWKKNHEGEKLLSQTFFVDISKKISILLSSDDKLLKTTANYYKERSHPFCFVRILLMWNI